MDKELAILAVHGMGDTPKTFADPLKEKLMKRIDVERWRKIHFDTIYYQDIFQVNQRAAMKRMRSRRDLDGIKLRKFLLFGFSDAAGLERKASAPNSHYHQVQKKIAAKLESVSRRLGSTTKPVIIIAHSLGGQVMSNYIWDSQLPQGAKRGVWMGKKPNNSDDRDKFLRLKTMRALFTTGCNIPIFVAGLEKSKIKAVKTASSGYNFAWRNYYDEDDVLGWPLQPLSPSYTKAVLDKEINADGGLVGWIFKSWNVLSHGGYWTDSDFLKPLVREIKKYV